MNKELKDTVGLMQSSFYKARFAAEYLQLKIRYDKLRAMVKAWDAGELKFTPTCPREMYDQQLQAMAQYLGVLMQRAELERVRLSDYEGGMDFAEAMKHLLNGEKIALPEWAGYWYLHEDGSIHLFTKDMQDLTTPDFAKYAGRKDWKVYDDVNALQLKEYQTQVFVDSKHSKQCHCHD